jgi:hydrogenase expression/formation protein HypC
MCLGIPGKIIAISDAQKSLAIIDVCSVKRQVNVACVIETNLDDLIGKWALIHVGFAMTLLDEEEAKKTLEALNAMQALDHEVDDFTGLAGEMGKLS